MQVEIEDGWQQVYFEKGTRFYLLRLCQDLWGKWEIIREFGRIGNKGGRKIIERQDNYISSVDRFGGLVVHRIKRQYVPKDTKQDF